MWKGPVEFCLDICESIKKAVGVAVHRQTMCILTAYVPQWRVCCGMPGGLHKSLKLIREYKSLNTNTQGGQAMAPPFPHFPGLYEVIRT